MHAFVARSPQTSQSRSAAAGPEGGEGSADEEEPGGAAAAEADADAGAGADAAGEGGVAEEGEDNAGDVAEVGGSVAALDGLPPFFFVMGWCAGVLEARWAVAGAVAASVPRTRGPSAGGGRGRGRREKREISSVVVLQRRPFSSVPGRALIFAVLYLVERSRARQVRGTTQEAQEDKATLTATVREKNEKRPVGASFSLF